MYYAENKLRARIFNNEPTMTDQSQANETDINVIVKRFGISGQVPQGNAQPMYGDFTMFPDNLRDMMHLARDLNERRAALPPQLKNMPIEQLLALTPEELTAILAPATTNEDNTANANTPTETTDPD